MNKLQTRVAQRNRRRVAVRARVFGIATKPRLNVFKSIKGMFVQLIDDEAGKTLVSVSMKEIDKKASVGERKGKVAESFLLGKLIAEKAVKAGITTIVFDRAGYRYHGRVAALADGAREGGLQF